MYGIHTYILHIATIRSSYEYDLEDEDADDPNLEPQPQRIKYID